MSEELNKEIRDFFIKIGEDIKIAFQECCPCFVRARVHAKAISDIENQITKDMNNTDARPVDVIIEIDNDEDVGETFKDDVEHFILEDNVIVKKNKFTKYYDCKDFYDDESESETKCVDSDYSEDDFVIIY